MSGTGGAAGTGGAGGATVACRPPADMTQPLPKLSQTGCMDAAAPTKFAALAFPYDVNSPLWSDGADKTRAFVLPTGEKVHVKDCSATAENCAGGTTDPDDGKWVFPVGTVMLKSFWFDGKVVETRLFVRHDASTWVGYSYAWTEDQSEATIVANEGAQVMFKTGSRTVDWHYPSRDDCMKCHKATAGSTLGPETAQMNRMGAAGMNQVDQLRQMGKLDGTPKTPYPALPTPYASQAGTPPTSATLDQLARSYMHANCAFCHRPDDGDVHDTDLRFGTALADAGFCGVAPAKTDLGVTGAVLIDPGKTATSLTWLRMQAAPDDSTGKHGRMPPVASFVTDQKAVDLIGRWIMSMTTCPI